MKNNNHLVIGGSILGLVAIAFYSMNMYKSYLEIKHLKLEKKYLDLEINKLKQQAEN